MINLPAVKELQRATLDAIYSEVPKVVKPRKNCLRKIRAMREDVLESIFGEFGVRLKHFSLLVDLDHKLCKLEENDYINQVLTTCEFMAEMDFDLLLDQIKKEIVSKIGKQPESKRIGNPRLNGQYIRFLGSRAERDSLRKNKIAHVVELNSFYKRNNWSWEAQPSNFSFYKRFDNSYEKELKKVRRKADQYLQLGCKELYDGIAETIIDTESIFNDNYLGFHRITMTSAAIIAAKMHNYACRNLELNHLNFNQKIFISASINSFPNFPLVKYTVYSPNSFVYKPRVYPYHELQGIAPPQVMALVGHLEDCEYLKGAAFDHYMVLIPSIEYCKETIDMAKENNQDIEDITKHLDISLVKGEYLVPVLLGERDGKCYFLSYWT
jgi:hypothetical protein